MAVARGGEQRQRNEGLPRLAGGPRFPDRATLFVAGYVDPQRDTKRGFWPAACMLVTLQDSGPFCWLVSKRIGISEALERRSLSDGALSRIVLESARV